MRNVAVFFGGISPEHDISCITGMQTLSALDEKKYRVFPVYVTKSGECYCENFLSLQDVANYRPKRRDKITLESGGIKKGFPYGKKIQIDCAVLCFHGGTYEGGGFSYKLDEAKIPYASSEAIPSGVSMDKNLQKLVAKALGIPVLPYIAIKDGETAFDVKFPVVVKPNSLGSSIGVSVCNTKEELASSLDLAFRFDDKALVEKKAEDFYELNISAMRCDKEVLLSAIEKPNTKEEILTFSEKYLSGGKKTDGMKSLKRECPAKVAEEVEKSVEKYAKTLYEELSLFGIVRLDFIVEKESVYFNEINVIPGSLSWYLWKEKGYSFSKLLDTAIEEGIRRSEKRKEKIRIIDTGVLK